MKIIYNNIIPFKGYKAMNLLGILFVRKEFEGKLKEQDITHEKIHSEQQKELLWIPFYIIYFIEFLVKFLYFGNWNYAYRRISFEREAYEFERYPEYLKTRKRYFWRKLL